MRSATLLLLLSLIVPAPPEPARAFNPIDRVEEDWELVILQPDVPAAGPQITTTMRASAMSPVVNFNLNYRDKPTFQAGGLQIQVWDGDQVLSLATHHDALLSTTVETVTWTQRMKLSGGSIEYEIRSGSSTTWDEFGEADLSLSFSSNLTDLSEYQSETSVAKSGIGWQSDHVTSMKLLRVKYYSGNDLVAIEDTPRIVHELVSE